MSVRPCPRTNPAKPPGIGPVTSASVKVPVNLAAEAARTAARSPVAGAGAAGPLGPSDPWPVRLDDPTAAAGRSTEAGFDVLPERTEGLPSPPADSPFVASP